MTITREGVHRRRLRAPRTGATRPQRAADPRRGRGRSAGRRRPGVRGRRRLLLRRRRARLRAALHGRVHGVACSYVDSTETGGSSYVCHVGHAASAIAAGKCRVALVTLAGKPRTGGVRGRGPQRRARRSPTSSRRGGCPARSNGYALAAQRHMHEFGTTSEQLAEIKVAASLHAQYNPHAFLQRRCHRRGGRSTRRWSAPRCTAWTAAW